MFLVVTILLLVKLPVSMTSVGRPDQEGPEREGREGVIEVPPIDPDCKPPKVCSILYFFDAVNDREPLGEVFGTNKAMIIRNVVRVQQSGNGGSYTIFKKKKHRL